MSAPESVEATVRNLPTLPGFFSLNKASVELKDPWVSFNHAVITRDGDRYFVADAHSRNGTFVLTTAFQRRAPSR